MPGRQTMHDDELTESGKLRRQSDHCRAEFGITLVELCALVAVVARYRCGHSVTTRATVDEFLQREEGFTVSRALRALERSGFVREVGRLNGAVCWHPTALGLQKLEWVGRERMAGAAE